ncbi:Leucine-rich repeat-containing protein 68, partial [Anas platyrhynchos]
GGRLARVGFFPSCIFVNTVFY